jgi:hypothetical protein
MHNTRQRLDNGLQDYKIYGTVIKKVCPSVSKQLATSWSKSMASRPDDLKFQNKLQSVVWLLVGIQGGKKKSETIFEKNWPRNVSNLEEDPYESSIVSYNKYME